MKYRSLFLIPARAGSKGLSGKNTKILDGKPLIQYSIDFAKVIVKPDDIICVSTNDQDVLRVCEKHNVMPPFIRPNELATDKSTTSSVISHAINFYKNKKIYFHDIVLLQPTSPFRLKEDFNVMLKLYNQFDCEMVASVKEVKENPYFNLFKENGNGFLENFLDPKKKVSRRQDAPLVYAFNGSIYLFKCSAFEAKNGLGFDKIVKYVMPDSRSVDIDTLIDWNIAEFYLKHSNENN